MKKEYFYGIRGIEFIWHGAWADPELIWHGKSFNYYDVETPLWHVYAEECSDAFEAEYFNTGEEWRIDDGSGDEYYFYSHHWSDDGKRAEIAAAAGCKPEDVKLYAFSGWTRTPEYTEVLA